MKNKIYKLLVMLFYASAVAWVAWWIFLRFQEPAKFTPDDFTDSYGIVALFLSGIGLVVSRQWGGFKSVFGKAIAFFAIGAGFQFLGQLIYTLYYRLGDVELAFPSVGDAAYFLGNLFYVFAVIFMIKLLCGPRKFYKPLWVTAVALIVTGVVLYSMTVSFLHIAVADERGTIYQVISVAFPLIQAFYFLLGLIALLQSRLLAGAKMFMSVTILLLALLMNFLADFTFLYNSYHETWEPAGLSELFYLLSYCLLGISIIMIANVRQKLLVPIADKPDNKDSEG